MRALWTLVVRPASDRQHVALRLLPSLLALLVLTLLPRSIPILPWQVYTFRTDSFTLHAPSHLLPPASCPLFPSPPSDRGHPGRFPLPPDWHVTASAFADVTYDGVPEWVLVVWRPWRDWPIQRWLPVPSPISGFHDAAGDSCHLILLDPGDGHEIWAGSALPAPLLAMAVGDVDGDRHAEVVTLEGDYRTGRGGPATHVGIWRWEDFGFVAEWRSPAGTFEGAVSALLRICLTDVDKDGILDVAVH
jgi:hypothetical protein